jgi:hypothetical protein
MTRRRRLSTALAALSALGATAALSGCFPSEESAACADWAHYDSPADAAEDADAVAFGTVVDQAGTTELYGYVVHVWVVEVDEWLQGTGDTTIEVVSTPRTCETGSPYPDGDPLDGAGDVLLLLTADGDRWQSLTGFQGVVPAPADGRMPTAWPSAPAER